MIETSTQNTLRQFVGSLVESAVSTGTPIDVARHAERATLVALQGAETSSTLARRRAEGYFWAVVRRRLVRMRRPSDATARFVLAAVVEDLLASGRDSREVWAELERGWGDKVSRDVLEEFRLRMCA